MPQFNFQCLKPFLVLIWKVFFLSFFLNVHANSIERQKNNILQCKIYRPDDIDNLTKGNLTELEKLWKQSGNFDWNQETSVNCQSRKNFVGETEGSVIFQDLHQAAPKDYPRLHSNDCFHRFCTKLIPNCHFVSGWENIYYERRIIFYVVILKRSLPERVAWER